jgi:hypothetical protein
MKLTEVPVQTLLAEAEMVTFAVIPGLTLIVNIFEFPLHCASVGKTLYNTDPG